MSTPGRPSAAPWITAAVAGVVLAALLIVYFVFLVPARNDQNSPSSAAGALSDTEKAAVVAAGTIAANLTSFRRAHFAADFARAQSGTTGDLRTQFTRRKSIILKALTSGKFDLSAKVTNTALEGPLDGKQKGYLVLVTLDGSNSTAKTQPVQTNAELTMVQRNGKWVAADLTNVAVQ